MWCVLRLIFGIKGLRGPKCPKPTLASLRLQPRFHFKLAFKNEDDVRTHKFYLHFTKEKLNIHTKYDHSSTLGLSMTVNRYSLLSRWLLCDGQYYGNGKARDVFAWTGDEVQLLLRDTRVYDNQGAGKHRLRVIEKTFQTSTWSEAFSEVSISGAQIRLNSVDARHECRNT